MNGEPDRSELERLAALNSYGILDTPGEAQFDAIVRDAAREFGTGAALISLIDHDRQWFKARVGIEPAETPRSISFCSYAIRGPAVMVVNDAATDERFAANPMVTGDPNIRFYAGAPLTTATGKRIGTVCVFDTAPRDGLSDDARQRLETLAARTMAAFEARRAAANGRSENACAAPPAAPLDGDRA